MTSCGFYNLFNIKLQEADTNYVAMQKENYSLLYVRNFSVNKFDSNILNWWLKTKKNRHYLLIGPYNKANWEFNSLFL